MGEMLVRLVIFEKFALIFFLLLSQIKRLIDESFSNIVEIYGSVQKAAHCDNG